MGAQTRQAGRGRVIAAVALVVIGSLSLTVGLFAGWAQRAVFDNDEFAARAVSVLDSAAVRHALAEEVTNEIIQHGRSSLASYRSELVGLVDDVMTTDGFREIFRRAVAQAHRAVFERNGAAVLLELGETLKLLSENSGNTSGAISAGLPSAAGGLLIDVTPAVRRLDLWRYANDARWLDEAALTLALICFVGAVALDRRRGVFELIGIGVAAAGVAIVLAAEVAPDVVVNRIHDPGEADAIHAGVARFVGDLKALGVWTIPFGVILVAAAEASRRSGRSRIAASFAALRRRSIADLSRPEQVGAGIGVAVAGLILVALRHRIVPMLVLVAGAYVVYLGAVLVIRALLGPEPDPGADAHRSWSRRALVGAAAAVVMILLATALVVNVTTASSSARERGELLCNGSADLCDRRLDQVAFAGSHNSMSAEADPGWLFAENQEGVPAQLEYGIRALLVKSHYGINSGIKVAGIPLIVTDKAAEIHNDADTEAEELGTEQVATVERIQRTVGAISGTPEIYLCHGYCELGATKFSQTLSQVRDFMNRNPNDVLIMIIGDYITAADTERAFEQAGLVDRVWTYDASRRPPTLGRMIKARQTLLVFSEHDGGSPPWYNHAYTTPQSVVQDTPFTFATPAEFSCAPNRGAPDSPLFQINHWITTKSPPSATEAKAVNSYEALMGRVEQCEQARQRFPTIVGVNFYSQGDLLKVVDDLNERGGSDD